MSKKISIVMAYHERQAQLDKTLYSLVASKYKNFDVIIIDDCSKEKIKCPDLPFDITILELDTKQGTNCGPIFNRGFQYAIDNNADIIIIQSPECYHVGDVISCASKITDDSYMAFGCFQLDKETTIKAHEINKLVKEHPYMVSFDGGSQLLGQNAWWNHSVYFPNPLYWCAAITTKNLIKLNGIDERFAFGYAHEDGYFVVQIKRLGLKIEIIDNPFVVHQWHTHILVDNKMELVKRNWDLYEKLLNDENYKSEHKYTPDLKNQWHLHIPKILHVYWGVGSLPYLRFQTVKTFMKLNPDWKIILWLPKHPSKVLTWNTGQLNYSSTWADYTVDLLNLPIEKKYFDLKEYGLSNNISEVHKSDFLRYHLLSEYGGVWTDMDILYFKSIVDLEVNKKENKDKETFVCISKYGHSNGFFMAAKGSKFFGEMFKLAYDADLSKYQGNGPDLCNKYYPKLEAINEFSPAIDIGMDAVYFYNAQRLLEIYDIKDAKFPETSIGIHWYAGHSLAGKFLNETNGGLVKSETLLGKLCKSLL